MSAKPLNPLGGVVIVVVGVVIVAWLTGWSVPVSKSQTPASLWIAGAAALGLLSGLATGLSAEAGSGKQFVTFLGAGILVPVLGGVGALLARSQEVTEQFTYAGTQVVEKTTRTVTVLSEDSVNPLVVLGSFFVAFALLAILGLIGGALLRKNEALTLKGA